MKIELACLLAVCVTAGFDDPCTVPEATNWGQACRMRELCGTGCAEGECKWHWEQED